MKKMYVQPNPEKELISSRIGGSSAALRPLPAQQRHAARACPILLPPPLLLLLLILLLRLLLLALFRQLLLHLPPPILAHARHCPARTARDPWFWVHRDRSNQHVSNIILVFLGLGDAYRTVSSFGSAPPLCSDA
jgi:hypothetical protein